MKTLIQQAQDKKYSEFNATTKEILAKKVAEELNNRGYFERLDVAKGKDINEAKMTNDQVLAACKKLAKNGDDKAKEFANGLISFYNKNGSFTPDQVSGLQNIMKNASFQMAEGEGDGDEYKKYFKEKMKKYGIKSPAELDEPEMKKFFDEVSKDWHK